MAWLSLFFSNQESSPPPMTPLFHFLLLAILILLAYTSYLHHQNEGYRHFFQLIQVVQIIFIYGWYALMIGNLKDSLPFYHCRMAMLMVLFLPDKHPWKRYFALIGIVGPILAFVNPVMDNYPVFHVTIFSFILGHYALWVNSIIYLLRFSDRAPLNKTRVLSGTLFFNSIILLVNQLTDGNYGFLRETPLLGEASAPIRFLAVSALLVTLVLGLDFLFQKFRLVENRLEIEDLVSQ